MFMAFGKNMQVFENQQKERIDPFNTLMNYQQTMYDYDYDPEDRPCMYPNDSYSKYAFPENINY